MKLPDAVLPAASVAEQLTVVVPGAKVDPEAGVHVTATEPSTISLAVALKVTTAPAAEVAETVILAGNDSVGGVVSTTVTLKLALPVLPAASVAEQLTVVVPNAKVEPDAGKQLGVIVPSTLSLADAEKLTAAPEGPVASAVRLPGTVTAGGVVSTTVTLKPPVATFPAASAAEQLTAVVPRAKVEPEAGEQFITTAPSTKSVAEAV